MLKLILSFIFFVYTIFVLEGKMQSAQYGSWVSPISAKMVAEGSLSFSEIKLVKGQVYWLERRPFEGGRTTLLSWNQIDGERELLPKQYNIRSRVHEYGGGSLLISDDKIYFVNDSDQQIYRLYPDGKVKKITSEKNSRFADGCIGQNDLLFYVKEEHADQVSNSIVRISQDGRVENVASGSDFYSNPRISPDGKYLAYISWDHPNMPWNETKLYLLDLQTNKTKIIAGSSSESIGDPKWNEFNELFYVSDKTNWWNIYKYGQKNPLSKLDAEFLLPQWVFNNSIYGFTSDAIFASYVQNGSNFFAKLGKNGSLKSIELPYTCLSSLSVENDKVALIVTSPQKPLSIVVYDVNSKESKIIKSSSNISLDDEFISQPTSIEFSSTGGRKSYGFYYPPKNPNFSPLKDEKPPLLVLSHGGPTANDSPKFSLKTLYWTSRGFGVVSVNYGGSTGYGKKYRDSLNGLFGIVDVEDCCSAAIYCVNSGLADKERLAIEGGSAGGFTTLLSLCHSNIFKVGADYFGVSDLETIAKDTHKFESRYLDRLVGPYPKYRELYQQRSPINFIDSITSPVIIFQGSEDAVVPPSQSEVVYESLKKRGIPTAYLLFDGEQHGFRKSENIIRSLEAELYFFSKILKIPLNEKIEPVQIDNLLLKPV